MSCHFNWVVSLFESGVYRLTFRIMGLGGKVVNKAARLLNTYKPQLTKVLTMPQYILKPYLRP